MAKKNKLWFSGEDAQLAARFTKFMTKVLYARRASYIRAVMVKAKHEISIEECRDEVDTVYRRLMNPIEESVESKLMWEGIKKYLHKLTPKECEVMISLGLKWAAVDFEQNTIEICHTVTTVRLDGKEVLVESNGTKTKSSKRTLPLVPVFRERLLALQEEQKENRKLCGRCYNKKYADYICVDAMGNLLKPDYLSNSFQIILQNYHLRRIRFHDLRHSCASLFLANGVPMKMIQEWLGHSDFSTTANIYSHLDYASKVSSAEAMLNGLGMGSNPGNDT